MSSYASPIAFYAADRRRKPSPEPDYGLWWRERDSDVPWRAAWVRDTGELYVCRSGPLSSGGGRVEVLARFEAREDLDEALAGWPERCGERGSLEWLRERARAWRAQTRRASAA